jgi:hypothetical protein
VWEQVVLTLVKRYFQSSRNVVCGSLLRTRAWQFWLVFLLMNRCFSTKTKLSAAYKHADGKKIDGKRVLVDVERARTVKGWLPRRLGELKLTLFDVHVF